MGFKIEIHPNACEALNTRASEILSKVSIESANNPSRDGWGDRYPAFRMTDDDVVGEITTRMTDVFGNVRAVSFSLGGAMYSISEPDYPLVENLIEQIFKIPRISHVLGESYVLEEFVQWCRNTLKSAAEESTERTEVPFVDFFAMCIERDVKTHEVWVPVATFEIQTEFDFGISRILTANADFFDRDLERRLKKYPDRADISRSFIEKYRKKLQGLAVVAVSVEAEDSHATAAATEIADTVIALLRLFSPAAFSPWLTCPCAVLGSEFTPRTIALSVGNEREIIALTEDADTRYTQPWRLSTSQLRTIQSSNLAELAELVQLEGLSEFSQAVRRSILTYSTGLTFLDVSDRLVYTLSALEGLLLKDSSEPIQQNLGERMAFLIGADGKQRRAIVVNVRAIYHARSQYVHHRRVSSIDKKVVEEFIVNSRSVLQGAFARHKLFPTKADFIVEVDKIKFGG